ncbi:TPA: hypothetical protein NH480_002826 [Pseudomonas aeruginosa]|nr:hypothetical protein [Pseudomonas aeruginosa]
MIRIKYLMKLVKSYEAVKKLKASSFGKQESQRIELTKDIFKAMVNENPTESPVAAAIAKTYLAAFPYPIFNGLLSYEPLDLALALNHHYLNALGRPASQLSAIELTQDEAHAIAKALCEDFDPSGIPLDLERKTSGLLGEFCRYLGKNSHIFYTAIEGKRQAQYTALGKGDYYQSTRALKLAELQQEHDQLEEDEESTRRSSSGLQVDNKPSLMERVMAKREAKRNQPAATPTPPQDQPEQIEDSESLELELVEETVEIPEDAYSQDSDDYGIEFEDAEEEEIETIDYDEDEDNSNESWVKLV